MGEESTNLPSLKFPVLPLTMDSPEHPLQTRASVPFKWEEQPGKPRPCTDIIVRPEPVGLVLELPPCRKLQHCSSSSTLLLDPYAEDKVTKTPSPTAVLDGPYNVGRPKFSSFRLFVTESVHDAVLESGLSSGSPREEEGFVEKMKKKKKRRGLFGKFSGGGGGGKKEALGGGLGFSSSSRFSPFSTTTSCDCESDQESIAKSLFADGKMKRNGSFSDGLSSHGGLNNGSSSSSSSRFLASIYEGLKQVIHWNSSSRKSSKEIHI